MIATAPAGTARLNGHPEELVLTEEGYAKLERALGRLATVERPEAIAQLSQALEVAGDLADNSEFLVAREELDFVDQRMALLEQRLQAARLLRPEERSSEVASLGTHVVLEDLDDGTRDEYVLVSTGEADPSAGRLSNDSPVGRAISGHHKGDVVDAHAPHRIRHLRIADLSA